MATAGITVRVNGESRTLPTGATIADLLRELALDKGRIAVEHNRRVVPRAEHAAARLEVHAAHRHRDHVRARGRVRVAHHGQRGVLPGADDEAGAELAPGEDQAVCHVLIIRHPRR